MAYAIFVDDELMQMAEAPGRRIPMPEALRAKVEEVSATALLNLVRLAGGDDITVNAYWNPREAQQEIEKATSPPVLVILDILNERRSTSTSISDDDRCGLVLGEQVFVKWPAVPIIFLTQFDCHQPERGRVAKIKSCRDYITKHTGSTIDLLQARVKQIFDDFRRDLGIVCKRLRLDHMRQKVFWRGFELGTAAKARDWPALLTEDLDLSDTSLTGGEKTFLQCIMTRAKTCWEKPEPLPARITFREIRQDCGNLSDEMIHKNVSRIRKSLGKVESSLFHEDEESAYNIFVNLKEAYLFTER